MPRVDRDKFYRQFRSLTNQFARDYKNKAVLVANDVLRDLDKGLDIQKSLDRAWAKHGVRESVKTRIESDVVRSAAYGYGILPNLITNPEEVIKRINYLRWSPDRLTLSQKLYKLDREMKASIADSIRVSFKNKESMTKTARRLFTGYGSSDKIPAADVPKYLRDIAKINRKLGNSKAVISAINKAERNISKIKTPGLKAAYQELLNVSQLEGTKAFQKAVEVSTQERSRYYAERIARTEYSRAYGDGMYSRQLDDPDIVALKRTLSESHSINDICDILSESDFYGMGAGIYPVGDVPQYPSHPHCNCRITEVYVGEVGKAGRYSSKAGTDYLNSISSKRRKEMIGATTSPSSWEKKLDPFGEGKNSKTKKAKNLYIKTK